MLGSSPPNCCHVIACLTAQYSPGARIRKKLLPTQKSIFLFAQGIVCEFLSLCMLMCVYMYTSPLRSSSSITITAGRMPGPFSWLSPSPFIFDILNDSIGEETQIYGQIIDGNYWRLMFNAHRTESHKT